MKGEIDIANLLANLFLRCPDTLKLFNIFTFLPNLTYSFNK